MAVVFGVITPINAFVKPENLLTIGLNASEIMLLAVGMTFLIGAGHLDLSVGYNLILASVVGAKVMVALGGNAAEVQRGVPQPRDRPAGRDPCRDRLGDGHGLLNGVLVTRLRLNSFIVTLATSGIFYGIALILTSAANVPFMPDAIQDDFGGAKSLDSFRTR